MLCYWLCAPAGSSLKALLANSNGLTGTIPTIPKSSQLESLAFSGNHLDGNKAVL